MLLCQISDPHIGFDRDDPDERNSARLRAVVERVARLDPAPELVIVSGDLTEHGDVASYRRLREMLRPLSGSVRLMPGNHDRRAALLQTFPDTASEGGFIAWTHEWDDRRLIALDTLDEGHGGGGFCADRAAWFAARLAERPTTPTLVALHHPPVPVGIDWMDPKPDAPWIERLRAPVAAHRQIVALIAGHLHLPIVASFADRPCIIASSVAPQLALDLRPIAGAAPDGRALIVDEPPSFSLHRWTEAGIASHYVRVEASVPIVRFDQDMAGVLARYMADNQGR